MITTISCLELKNQRVFNKKINFSFVQLEIEIFDSKTWSEVPTRKYVLVFLKLAPLGSWLLGSLCTNDVEIRVAWNPDSSTRIQCLIILCWQQRSHVRKCQPKNVNSNHWIQNQAASGISIWCWIHCTVKLLLSERWFFMIMKANYYENHIDLLKWD